MVARYFSAHVSRRSPFCLIHSQFDPFPLVFLVCALFFSSSPSFRTSYIILLFLLVPVSVFLTSSAGVQTTTGLWATPFLTLELSMGVAHLIFLPTLLFLVPLPVAHAPYPSCSSFYSPPQPAHFANLFVHTVLTPGFPFGPRIPHILQFLSFHPNNSQHPLLCCVQVQILQDPLFKLFSTPLWNFSLFCIQVSQAASPTQTRPLKTEEKRVSRLSTLEVQRNSA